MRRIESGAPDVLAWTRGPVEDELLVLVSFVAEARRVDLRAVAPGEWSARVGSHREPAGPDANGIVTLRPDEAVILARASKAT
jgi:hypothetical protein